MHVVCLTCADELDHCHGTLVTHLDDQVECTQDGCTDVDAARHALLADCTSVLAECDCVQEPALIRKAS